MSHDVTVSHDTHTHTHTHTNTHTHTQTHTHTHTGGCTCNDSSRQCIMSAVTRLPLPTQWSSCSRADLNTGLTTHNLGRCLTNEPTMTVGDPACGNGIQEENETCDCGSPQVSVANDSNFTTLFSHYLPHLNYLHEQIILFPSPPLFPIHTTPS